MPPTLDEMLRSSLWAEALGADEFDRVRAECYERRVPAGGFVVRSGEPVDCWSGVIDGLVKMSVSLPDGHLSTLTGVTAGGWFGEGSLLQGGVWRYDAIAVRDTRVARMPCTTFERLQQTNFAFNRFLLLHLNARLSLFIGLVEYERLLGPEGRVARSLASLFDPQLYPRTSSFIRLSQDEIGLLAGVSRQRTNVALHELERAGLLRIEFGGVSVLDVRGLHRYMPLRKATKAAAEPRQAASAEAPRAEPAPSAAGETADGPHLGRTRRASAGIGDQPRGMLDQRSVVGPATERGVLEPDPHMAARAHGRTDQRPDVHAQPGDHPRRVRRFLV